MKIMKKLIFLFLIPILSFGQQVQTVPFGGTGKKTFTAYAVLTAGTTSTGVFQNVSGLGTTGQVLTSNGAGALPSWQSVASYLKADGSVTGATTFGTQQVFTYGVRSGTFRNLSGQHTYLTSDVGKDIYIFTGTNLASIAISDAGGSINIGDAAATTAISLDVVAGTIYMPAANGIDFGGSTLTSGTWNGNTVGIAYGGTGLTTLGTIGTSTNDNATSGNVGQEISAIQSTYTNFTTTATYQNITSIALTAGDWDISAFYTYSSNSATITAASNSIFVISTTTASASGATEGKNISYVPQAALLGTSKFTDAITPYRVSISGSTTYYLNTQATFTIGNPQFVGGLRARRMR